MTITSNERDPKKTKDLTRAELWKQLENAINLRSSQDQVLWSIFGTFWAANAILLIAIFPGISLPSGWPAIAISIVGIFLALIWYSTQERALGHLSRHEGLITKIETKLGIDPTYAISADLNTPLYDKYLRKGLKARWVMRASSIGIGFFWLILFLFYLATSLIAIP